MAYKLIQKIKDGYRKVADFLNVDIKRSSPENIDAFIDYCTKNKLEVLVDEGAEVAFFSGDQPSILDQTGCYTMVIDTKEAQNPKTIAIKSRTYTASSILDVVKDYKAEKDALLKRFEDNQIKYQLV